MKKIRLLVMPLMAMSLLASCGNKAATKIIYGNIITMDDTNPVAEAVAFKGGKIIAVGSKEEVNKRVKGSVSKKTLKNDQYLYPGFVDTHTHYAVMTNILAGAAMIDREKYTYGDYKAYAEEVKKFMNENPNKEIYQSYGMWVAENPDYPGVKTPTAALLDQYCPTEKPIVMIGAGGHDCWLNTPAIKRFVGDYEKNPSAVDQWINEVGEDCVIFEEKNGHKIPKGYFCETARFRITDQLPHTVQEIKDTIIGLQKTTLSKGYTTVGDCTIVESSTNKQVTAFKELNKEGKLKLKFRSYYEIREYDSKETRKSELKRAIALANETRGDEHFEVIGIKVFLDGVYEALSSYMLNEYTSEAGKREGYKGIQRWYGSLDNELKELVYNANKAGLAMEFHAMGDAAIKQALDACEYSATKFKEEFKPKFPNNAISHLGYIDPDGVDPDGLTKGLKDIERFERLGVTAVVAPEWACNAKSIYPQEKKVLGEPKVEQMFKIKSIMGTGANVAFHTDGAVLGGVPEMIYDATTRLDATHQDSIIRGPEECITGEQSLKCLTTNAVIPLNSETITGCIKVGSPADFTIYNKDYRNNEVATNLDTFKTAKLQGLYVNGVDTLAK